MKFNENHIIKSNKQDSPKLFLDQKGQVSIFLAVITTIVITLVAFVINVGLFVKAKINLQNAGQDADDLVDSAGYDGRNFDDKFKSSKNKFNTLRFEDV